MSNDKILINGPFNTVRLEGFVGDIKKVIYLFFDYHETIEDQTKCDGFDNIDITNYIYNNIKNAKSSLDVFVEIVKSSIPFKMGNHNKIYISKIRELFKQEYQMKNNKSLPSKTNNIVRLHYFDIREYESYLIYRYEYINGFQVGDIEYMLEDFKILNIDMNNLYTSLFGDLNDKKTIRSINEIGKIYNNNKLNSIIPSIQKDIIKIREKYNHNDIKKKLEPFFELLKKIFDELFESINVINKLTENANNKIKNTNFDFKKKIIIDDFIKIFGKSHEYNNIDIELLKNLNNISSEYKKIHRYIIIIFSTIMDIYLLRRFLDKDYITNSVVFCGGAHSINYVIQLIQHFNFKITHYSYSSIKNIDDLNSFIKKQNKYSDYYKAFDVLSPEYLQQCSDLTNFPKNFQ